jgi:hypothetical protein
VSEPEELRERVAELERWRDEIAERLGNLESGMRGINEWVADTASVVAMADDVIPEGVIWESPKTVWPAIGETE